MNTVDEKVKELREALQKEMGENVTITIKGEKKEKSPNKGILFAKGLFGSMFDKVSNSIHNTIKKGEERSKKEK